MLVLQPVSVDTIWGSNRLHSYSGDRKMKRIGQLYSVIAKKDTSNTVLNGAYKGRSLYEIYNSSPSLFGCDKDVVFPLIIGFVDASMNLSIQVHPTDAYAKEKLQLTSGKNESWYFIEEPSTKKIYNGLLCKSINELSKAIEEEKVLDVIDELPVKKGDYVYVESGTVHALTSGSLVYEIQQATDITYRLYDYKRVDEAGKARKLHKEEAMEVVRPEKKSESYPFQKQFQEEYYTLELIDKCRNYINERNSFVCVTILEGQFCYGNVVVKKGMSCIVFPGEAIHTDQEITCIIAEPKNKEVLE